VKKEVPKLNSWKFNVHNTFEIVPKIEIMDLDSHSGNMKNDSGAEIMTVSKRKGRTKLHTSNLSKKMSVDKNFDILSENMVQKSHEESCELVRSFSDREYYTTRKLSNLIKAEEINEKAIIEMKIAASMKNILFCSISHELRSPINHINGMLEVLRSKVEDEDLLRYIRIAIASWTMLKSKIDDILDYSMLETSSCQIKNEPFNIRNMMMEIEELISSQYDPRFITFGMYVSESLPDEVYHDEKRIRQILINLIWNALKFTEKGFVNVVVDCTFEEQNKQLRSFEMKDSSRKKCNLHFAVSDSGWGIEKKKRLHLYKMFSEAGYSWNNDINKSTKLMGIGLAFWQRMLQEMRSELEMTTVLKIGSTFSFKLASEFIQHSDSFLLKKRMSSVPFIDEEEMEEDIMHKSSDHEPKNTKIIELNKAKAMSMNRSTLKYSSMERVRNLRMNQNTQKTAFSNKEFHISTTPIAKEG
jgi:signal transduction histidine kinase